MLLLSNAEFFSKLNFSKNSSRNTIRLSNGLDLDQEGLSFGPDLGSCCLHSLPEDNKKSPLARKELKPYQTTEMILITFYHMMCCLGVI